MKNKKLKLARVERDLSQADLAAAVGVTRQTIGLIEAGGYNPTLNLCIAICKALGKTLDELFWEEDGNEIVCKKAGG
ncbi:MAG: helix-turn-helix transcriptional regulator [Eubacteriales bacterium]|nr:helix-turn-helix transcriptional regulator [Eubacteriales bacterium]